MIHPQHHVAVRRLQEAVESEYPEGQITLSTWDARAILALLGCGDAPPPEDSPDLAEVA